MMDDMKTLVWVVLVSLLVGIFFSPSYAAEKPVALPPAFDVQAVPVSQVVGLYYKEVVNRPYVICDAVLQDQRLVSVRGFGKSLDAAMLSGILDANGYEAKDAHGVMIVCTKSKQILEEDENVFVYRPLWRDTGYLVDLLTPLVQGKFANKRAAAAAMSVGGAQSGGAAMPSAGSLPGMNSMSVSPASSMRPNSGDDYLVFAGSDREKEKLQKLLAQVDVRPGEVLIKAYVYEVGTNKKEGSAIDMALSLLQGKFSITIGSTASELGNAIKITTPSLSAVASALSTDGRFKVVTSPYSRVRSGSTGRFVVGSDVPVLGSIVTSGNGTTQQSVTMMSSGTIFEVTPRVRDKSTDVDLFEQISSFVATTSGVNNTPTLNKRELRTSLTVEDGEVLVIGGLNASLDDANKSGLPWLPFPFSSSSGSSSSELLVIMELKRI